MVSFIGLNLKTRLLLDSMKNDNNKPTTSRKFIKQNKKSEQSNKGLWKDRMGSGAIGGVSITCRPVAPAMCLLTRLWKTEETVQNVVNLLYIYV